MKSSALSRKGAQQGAQNTEQLLELDQMLIVSLRPFKLAEPQELLPGTKDKGRFLDGRAGL